MGKDPMPPIPCGMWLLMAAVVLAAGCWLLVSAVAS